MKKILKGLRIGIIGIAGCTIYLVFSFIGAVITLIIIGSLFNLIF